MKKIIFFLLSLLIITYLVIDITYNFPEKYLVKNVKLSLFEVVKNDPQTDCYILEHITNCKNINLSKTYLLGFICELRYVDLIHEHIFFSPNEVYGWQGSVNKIKTVNILNGKKFIANKLSNAFKYSKFHTNIDINYHKVTDGLKGSSCYQATCYDNMDSFINDFNNNNVSKRMNLQLKSYHLFCLSNSILSDIKINGLDMIFRFDNGIELSSEIR